MRASVKFATLQLCLGASFLAQTASAVATRGSSTHLLSPDQGQALADFVVRSAPDVHPKPDCSHLVHLLYSSAGLNYSYQGSRQLHRGVPEFIRVRVPQPGDLIVWVGHVGIVLSPDDTTFLSSVRSGIMTESWTNDYWSNRGRPRFFRYVVGPQADLTLLADVRPSRRRNAARAEESRTISEPPDSPRPAASSSDDQEFSSAIAAVRRHSRPDDKEIAAAFLQGSTDRAHRLLSGELLDPGSLVCVVERAEVRQLKIKRSTGTIQLKLTETLCLEHGTAMPGATVEQEFALDRRDGFWVISDPNQRLYLPREQAIAVFERQLQLILQAGSASDSKRGLIKALNLLYDREPSGLAATEARRR